MKIFWIFFINILISYNYCEKPDNQLLVKKTIPWSNERLSVLINKLGDESCYHEEKCAQNWLQKLNFLTEKIFERGSFLQFAFETNITDYNQKQLEEFSSVSNRFSQVTLRIAKKYFKHSKYWNDVIRRMLFLASRGFSFKHDEDANESSRINNELNEIYATAKVCNKSECFTIDKINEIMANSRDADKLEWIWKEWHEATGPKLKDLFAQSIMLQNKAAQESGYNDLSELWIEEFEKDNFENLIDDLYESIKPLYEQLHAYVRRKLSSLYRLGDKSKLIPEHLLGNMWAQSWENIFDIVQPYKNVPLVNITEKLLEKNYSVERIFFEAESFFVSMSLPRMTPTFWKESLFVRPSDRSIQCHASASDFFNGFDYRIKMCTKINSEDFNVVHHEMGHIEYYMNYAHQPAIFRAGANSAFHEAIGDTISLSVYSQKHLYRKGFVKKEDLSYEEMINFLMNMALKKIAFLPFSYLVDKWRWNVFRGNITSENYNREWWNMKVKYQGVMAPIKRNESYFDPGSKYHVAANVPYVRYFLSHFHQFEFYEALCKLSGHKGLLFNCDFFGSKRAGDSLKKILSLGTSKHWSIALKQLTNHENIQTSSLIKYFEPLYHWLKNENANLFDEKVGW